MIKPWEISVLVYDYLKKSGMKKTLICYNEECSSLRLPDPPPPIFSCVLEKLLNHGDLEHRLQSFDGSKKGDTGKEQSGLKRMMELDDEMLEYMRKKFKKRKRNSGDHGRGKKNKNPPSAQKERPKICPSSSISQHAVVEDNLHTQGPLLVNQNADSNRELLEHTDRVVTSSCEGKLQTPEKRLSSSRRKAATPKKLVTNQDSLVKSLADNINAKNEEAALDTLNSVEPWLEQFINSLSENPDESELQNSVDPNINIPMITSLNEEAAMSLLALNQSNPSESKSSPSSAVHSSGVTNPNSENVPHPSTVQPQPTQSASFPASLLASQNTSDHLSVAFNTANTSTSSSCNVVASTLKSSLTSSNLDNISFDPIRIQNQKTMSLAQNNPNMEVIVLPKNVQSQYQHILPKPKQAPDPVPATFHVVGDTVAPVYNFIKTTPQQEAQKFFGQLQRPYHQQLSRIDQLYLVDKSSLQPPVSDGVRSVGASQTPSTPVISSNGTDSSTQANQQVSTGSTKTPETKSTSSKESFVSWDQKIRKSIAETHFKTPSSKLTPVKNRPKSEIKKSPKNRDCEKKKNASHSPTKLSKSVDLIKKKNKKKKYKSKKGDSERNSKSKKKKKLKKRREKEKETVKRPPITPEFVNESLSSEEEDSITKTPRVRHMSESDTMMAEDLLKSFNSTSNHPQDTSTPNTSKPTKSSKPRRITDSIKPAFIEENANSSFDIDESSRPKPVVIPEHSQNSCSCHSSHYRDQQKSKCTNSKTFSFNEDDHVNSPRNYNDANSITVASLFPQISNSSISCSPNQKISDSKTYRNQKPEEESDQDQEEGISEEDEIREKTSKLPPLSSSQKDLLDTSDEEQNSSLKSEEPRLTSSVRLTTSLALSESDMDSPLKKSPVKSPKLKLPQTTRKETHLFPKEKLKDPSPTKSKGNDLDKEVLATELSENEDQDLPDFNISDDIDDSQELIIDGEYPLIESSAASKNVTNSNSRPRRTSSAKARGKIKRASKPSPSENDKNTENAAVASIVEDSCDVWYQNVPNRMKAEAKPSFVCEICRKSFPSVAVLSVHSESCSKMYLVCTNCGRKCSSKSGLTLHKKSCLNMANTSKSKDKRRSSGEKSKIKISPTNPKSGAQRKSLKKKKPKSPYIAKDIDEFLGTLRYQ